MSIALFLTYSATLCRSIAPSRSADHGNLQSATFTQQRSAAEHGSAILAKPGQEPGDTLYEHPVGASARVTAVTCGCLICEAATDDGHTAGCSVPADQPGTGDW